MTSRPKALIAGAGISGLAAAHGLLQSGYEVTVLEAGDEVGGCLRSVERDGFLLELGANTVQRAAAVEELCRLADCEDALLSPASAAQRRYVVRKGRPVALPSSPPGILRTPILSPLARLRLLLEPFVGRARGEESVAAFFARRLGRQPAVRLLDAMVLGIYAGDPAELSLRRAFPRIAAMEAEHGSLLRALRKAPPRPPLAGFEDGMGGWARRLAAPLHVRFGARVQAVEVSEVGFRVRWLGTDDALRRSPCDRVAVALPAAAAAEVLADLADTESWGAIAHAPVAVVHLGFPRAQVEHPLDGFGLLSPHREGRPILGCLFSSTIFPRVAPADQILLTVMLGGRRNPEVVQESDETLTSVARGAVMELLGASGAATLQHVTRWLPGIPQPTALQAEVERTAAALEAAHPGLDVLGSWRGGVGVPDCIQAGLSLGLAEP